MHRLSWTSTVGLPVSISDFLVLILIPFQAVERIKEYLEVPQEAPARVPNPPPAAWPSSEGGIVVEDLVVRYAPTLPAVLRGITFSVRPREKVGVVSERSMGEIAL